MIKFHLMNALDRVMGWAIKSEFLSSSHTNRDLVLDFWRGVSVTMVLVHHLFGTPGAHTPFTTRIGPLGVQFFFVISGYIITKLLLAEKAKTSKISIKNFYIRRVFRIFPALFGYMVFLTFLELLRWAHTPDIPSAIFVCSIIPCTWNVAHTWSLGIEEMFYAFWPLVLVFLPQKYYPHFLIALIAACYSLMPFDVLLFQGGHSDLPFSFACIAAGALCAVSARVQRAVGGWGAPAVYGVIIFVFLLPFPHMILLRYLTPLAILVTIFSTYRFPRLITTYPFKAVASLGLVSYSLYLYQQAFTAPSYPATSFLQYPVFMIVFAVLSYFVIEKPAIRIGKQYIRSASSAAKSIEREPGI